MPNYHLEEYTVLGLDEEATYQDVHDRHAALISYVKDDSSYETTVIQLNLAKDRLAKLLKPVSEECVVFIIDFDRTITIKTSNDEKYLNNCDDQTILNNIRNSFAFKNLVLTAIAKGHRIAIATFNEKCVIHQNKKIYLARRFLLALFDEEIVAQIWIAAKNDQSIKNKVHHVNEIKKAYQAKLSQLVMIDDDDEVLNNTAKKLSGKLTIFNVPIFEEDHYLEYLNLLLLLTRALSHLPLLKEIPLLIEQCRRYLQICNAHNSNQRKVLELLKKYIFNNFDNMPACTKLLGLIQLINNRAPYNEIVNELLNYESFQFALCYDATILQVLDNIIASTLLPETSQDSWNKAAVTTAIMNARYQYFVKFKTNNFIALPAAKLMLITINSDSDILAEKFFGLLPSESLINLLQDFLARCTWKIASVLLRLHSSTLQNIFNVRQYPNNLQNSYTRLPRILFPSPAALSDAGKQLLLILRMHITQQQISQQNNIILFHYLALEITFGDIEHFSSALASLSSSTETRQLKQQLLLNMLSLTILPVSCEKNTALLKPWLEALLNNYIDITNKELIEQKILDEAIHLRNVEIFNLLNKYFILPKIDTNRITFSIHIQAYDIAICLFNLIDIKDIDENYIHNLVNIQQLSLKFIENIRSIAQAKGMQLSNIDLRLLLLNAIEQGNVCRVQEILNRDAVLIDEYIIQFVINHQRAEILALLVKKAVPQIDFNKLLHNIVTMDVHISYNDPAHLAKSSRCDLLRALIISGKITHLDNIDGSGKTLLHHLIERYEIESIELLVRLGVNPLIQDANNRTALMFAKEIYNHVDFATEEDDFQIDLENVNSTNITPQTQNNNNLIFQAETTVQDGRDKIVELLSVAESRHNPITTAVTSAISHFYNLVLSNQLTLTIQFLTQNIIIKNTLSDKDNPLSFDLLNIVLFKTKNSLMLDTLLSAGVYMQLCEAPMHRILCQIISQMLNMHISTSNIAFELFNILCSHLFKNPNAKKLFTDIELLRMLVQVASQDTNTLNSGYHLLDKFVAAFGSELFYQPLLTENITENQYNFLMKVREAYPRKSVQELQTNSGSVIPSPSACVTTTTTTGIDPGRTSDSKNISRFSSVCKKYPEERDNKRLKPETTDSNSTFITDIAKSPACP